MIQIKVFIRTDCVAVGILNVRTQPLRMVPTTLMDDYLMLINDVITLVYMPRPYCSHDLCFTVNDLFIR